MGWPASSLSLLLPHSAPPFGKWCPDSHQNPLALSVTAILAMLINLASALLLLQLSKHETALVRGAWLAARNDVLANLLILAAGIVTLFWFNPWPDIMVGLVIGIINLSAAAEVFEQARAENPELELDDDDD
ncbi:cation transporter [Corynebacterium belfantii]|uniref:cation transporter n=1 Tax=Corynebacterium belfantii TaxID=2014537 RepID=UPI001F3094D5|nr:cation transporter [Corynebacterium belfantii]